uniref:Uncharacterized protein n=1 Tax=Ulva compressa TaxID=63659 RepID=A0A3S6P900_ULVCO|nr:hypothetical protein [Ulva compressa]ATP01501.1 hypothetical protein [Ulva compressa]
MLFKVEKLQQHVETAGDFSKGLIRYLAELNNSLNKITDNENLKLYAFQFFTELGSLVYPNAGACYSLIPGDLKEIAWKKSLEKFNTKISKSEKNSNLLSTLNVFLNDNYSQTLTCLVAICLANEISKAIKNPAVIQKSLLNESIKSKVTEMPHQLIASSWVGNLSVCLKNHLFGIAPELTGEVKKLIEIYCLELAKEISISKY